MRNNSRAVYAKFRYRNPQELQLAVTFPCHIQVGIDITTTTASAPQPERRLEELEAAFFGSCGTD